MLHIYLLLPSTEHCYQQNELTVHLYLDITQCCEFLYQLAISFDLPVLAELEAQRKKRAANREKYYRKKERQKLLAQQEQSDAGTEASPAEQTA